MSDTFEDRLQELRDRFRDRALADTTTIEGMAEDIRNGVGPADLAAQLRQIAHRLAGGGGTFGFAEISARATELEDLLIDHPGDADLTKRCRALVEEIRKAA